MLGISGALSERPRRTSWRFIHSVPIAAAACTKTGRARATRTLDEAWVVELSNTDTLIALAGNKADLEANRVIDRETARAYAESMNILYMETSAKTGQNVNELFHDIAVRLPKQSTDEEEKAKVGAGATRYRAASVQVRCRCETNLRSLRVSLGPTSTKRGPG